MIELCSTHQTNFIENDFDWSGVRNYGDEMKQQISDTFAPDPTPFSSDFFVVYSFVKLLAMLQNMGVTQCGIVEV